MKIYMFILFLVLACSLTRPAVMAQSIGQTSVTLNDPARGNRQVTAELYYPATSAGQNTPILPGVYPLLVYGHGFVMVWSAYQNVWADLVPKGYLVAFPTTEGGFSPVHAEFGADLTFLLTAIRAGGAAPSVPAANVGNTSAIMGHSMGGGSCFLGAAGAAGNSPPTAMVTFAAANTTPSSIAAAPQVGIPTLLFSGANDCVTPPSQHQDLMYDATASAYKTQISITGGGHCFFANSNLNCSFGESTCTPVPTITRAQQQSIVSVFLSNWLARFLKNDCSKGEAFQDSLQNHPGITYRQSRSIACATGLGDDSAAGRAPLVFPNPFSHTLSVEPVDVSATYTLSDVWGRVLSSGCGLEGQNFSFLPQGCYFLRMETKSGIFTRKIVKK